MNFILLTLVLCWDASPSQNVTSYEVYQNGVATQEVTGTRTTLTNLNELETYNFYVTAKNSTLESDPSNIVTWHRPRMAMLAPGEFTFTRPVNRVDETFVVQSTADLKTWVDELNPVENVQSVSPDGMIETVHVLIPAPDPVRFYRIRIDVVPTGCAVGG